ncbi:hypothetical protein Dimus_009351 [Dionaea muscipula]
MIIYQRPHRYLMQVALWMTYGTFVGGSAGSLLGCLSILVLTMIVGDPTDQAIPSGSALTDNSGVVFGKLCDLKVS